MERLAIVRSLRLTQDTRLIFEGYFVDKQSSKVLSLK